MKILNSCTNRSFEKSPSIILIGYNMFVDHGHKTYKLDRDCKSLENHCCKYKTKAYAFDF